MSCSLFEELNQNLVSVVARYRNIVWLAPRYYAHCEIGAVQNVETSVGVSPNRDVGSAVTVIIVLS